MIDHAWVHDNLDAYLTGDLTTNERESVELHAAVCDACQRALADARRLEQTMSSLFADARPDANLEDRLIQELRKEPARVFQRPTVWRFVGAAAAVLVVGLIGAFAQAISSEGGLSMEANGAALSARLQGGRDLVGGTILVEGDAESRVAEMQKRFAEGGDPDWVDSYAQVVHGRTNHGANYAPDAEVLKQSVEKIQEAGYEKNKEIRTINRQTTIQGGKLKLDGLADGKELLNLFLDKMDKGESKKTTEEQGKATRPAASFFRGEEGKEGREAAEMEKLMKHLYKNAETPLAPGLVQSPALKIFAIPGAPNGTLPGRGYFDDLAPRMVTPALPVTPTGVPSPIPSDPKVNDGKGDVTSRDNGDKQGEKGDKKPTEEGTKKQPEPKTAVQPKPFEPPLETSRKIIRTGEMDFETESFDKAVDEVTKLITAVKGGFIATINSDKLPNGKMRGSVVVRMPPQFLDKFVLDLRRELAKSGELKNQRIISLDVTKQYTDIESRLRAARTMEDRLIQIIKIGKGEIKDLVAAEKELGVWRTKIEEMEGEIRYYGNQVSLSTLTITLTEKEILAATAIVVTENVRMRLEVEDVAKAHQTAMAAVLEVKGRITKSELKQHSAGQLQSILHAEIPPAQKDAFRDRLKKLGIVSSHEESQSQHTEGGSGRSADLKPKTSDVQFDVTMHNSANVRPRLSADLKIATSDVPTAYAKLLDEIAKAKGQVRDGKLNEQDKLNITATLDFNVPIAEKPAIDKVIADIGPVLERINIRTPLSELSTDRKFGYTLLLRDFASIPPSKATIEVLAVADVPAAYAKLNDAIAKAKGQLADAKLDEKDKLNINAQLDFTVLTEEKPIIEAMLKELGSSLSRTNMDAPMKQLSTAKKFGYTLILRDFASIPPSKATDLKVAVNDVPASYAKLLEAIAKAKGQAADARLDEKDKLHITAHFTFTVPSEEKASIDKLLLELGTVLSRNNVQAATTVLSTPKKFGYSLELRDFATIPPTHVSAVTVAASNVPTNFAKLVDAVAKAKGLLATAKLNEQDKLNVNAQLSFTVPTAEKATIEKLLAEIGTILSRTNEQAPMNELSSDGKFGYSVMLRDFASIPPRETFILQVALNDVPGTFRDLQDAVAQAKGWISVGKLVEDNKAKIEAQFDFDVPSAEKMVIERMLAKAGAIVSRTSSQIPVNELATDQKVGYRLSLRNTASIPPREKTLLKFEVADVDGKVIEFKEQVFAAKGRVVDSTVDRHENGQVTAVIVFEVPFASQDTLIRQMKGSAKLVLQRSTRNQQVQENELTTSHLVVTVTGASNIVPPEEGITASVRASLYYSFKILMYFVMAIIVGLSFVVPVAVLSWIAYKLYTLSIGSSPMPGAISTLAPAGGLSMGDDDKPAESDPAKS